MLGHMDNKEPTVILRDPAPTKKVNGLMCTRQATDRDLESSSTMKKTSVIFDIFVRIYCFWN